MRFNAKAKIRVTVKAEGLNIRAMTGACVVGEFYAYVSSRVNGRLEGKGRGVKPISAG